MNLGVYLNPGRDLAEAVGLTRLAESLEYESAWVTHGAGRDSFVVLAAYATATTGLRLGNRVVPIYPRHPVAMAQAALTLSELSGGRFSLGIGVSHASMIESMLGLSLTDPLGVMREYVAVLRGALGAGTSFTGTHYRVQWAMALPAPPPAPPLYLAGLSTRMLELAGEIADGAVLWLTSPDYVKNVAVPALARGRLRAGKTLEDFEIVCAVPIAIADDVRAATAAFKTELARYLRLPFYRKMIDASGHGADLKVFDRDGAVTDALVRTLGAVGSARDGRAFIRAYRDAGVTLPAVRPITFPDAPWYRPTLEAMAGC
jgi:alkanesulfonate monooxygenase SsuD/methylene tetrahydromethanopterin reductase-like flavin-dependent oxidoreductase (luciferase family)